MHKIYRHVLPLLLAIIFGLIILWPIRESGAWYPMHDSTHPTRLVLMSWTILSGQFPPIWAGTINGGFGYPLFHFYAPLFHLLSSAFNLLYLNLYPTTALKLTLLLSSVVGSLGTYYFSRRWGRSAAIVASASFALSPYLASNIYVRGAFSEYLSIAILPWVLLSSQNVATWKRMVFAASMISLLLLSHNLLPILSLPLILVWLLYHNASRLGRVVITLGLAFLLTSWFLLPLLLERGFTNADEIAKTTNYSLHFITPSQMWDSTWGFGGSVAGVEDGMSFKIGKIQIILGIIGVIIAWLKKQKSMILLSLFVFLSGWLSTNYSTWIWDNLSLIQVVQFPWRNLAILSLLLSLLAGYAISRLPTRIIRISSALLVSLILIFYNLKYFKPQTILQSPLDNWELSDSDIPDISETVPEFLPRWFDKASLQSTSLDGGRIDIWEAINVTDSNSDELQGLLPSGRYHFDLIGEPGASIKVAAAYYPTWSATIDGQPVDIKPSEQGLIQIEIPSGPHTVDIFQSPTPLQQGSRAVTLFTILAIIMSFYPRKKHGKL